MNVQPSRRPRVRAPEPQGRGGWLNTGGEQLSLSALRGRIVVLDFWTFCCINCLHVIDELRELEERHADTVVVIGVHSPKFVHEADHEAVTAAVERYGVHHPVLDDPELTTWKNYGVRAWPTLVVIDPEGYVVAQHAGEGHVHAIEALVRELEREHDAKGTLRRGDGPYRPPEPEPTDLRFPGKAVLLPGGGYLVADSGHHSLVELALDGATVVRRIGTGERGLLDGPADLAAFNEPQGLALLPAEVAGRLGADVVVADTVNHALRGVRLADGAVTTLAGTGRQWWQGSPTAGPGREIALSSPWDVAWYRDRVWIAMAGVHQLWTYDPADGTVRVAAGTTNEGLVDGPVEQAWFAQTSGLAVSPDGERLWLADSETSALRWIDADPGTVAEPTAPTAPGEAVAVDAAEPTAEDAAGAPGGGEGDAGPRLYVHTAVGTGLFDFGHRDGPAAQALLQHPLGVTVLPDGSVAISDTYNSALRRYDPASDEVTTLATELREPSGAVLLPAGAEGAAGAGEEAARRELVVIESAAHRLTRVRLPEEATRLDAGAHRTQRPVTPVGPGKLRLDVVFSPPPGQKLDDRWGPSTRLLVSATPPELIADGAGTGTDLFRDLVLGGTVTEGVLHVSAMAASCDDAADVEFPACHMHQQDWGIPVRIEPGATERLPLLLAGLDAPTAE
ncbi:NHL domain-containing thioredoxin family protein [Allostreptomyces psammosilenae]|uniref:Thiol-disulfide isomerase/thioredoxin n=1 Tax=Allostreptomyces psammosilenae TaxID=1892865 RepID=A0A852ZSF2_9ACTN|nr:NHL domain-containing thioredoxin family protein [Allostreptomyces psammosilenae]NYI05323.1 thiol-disulfide isomerase/thioredoxin [Allostreptomyces psammosilenae]